MSDYEDEQEEFEEEENWDNEDENESVKNSDDESYDDNDDNDDSKTDEDNDRFEYLNDQSSMIKDANKLIQIIVVPENKMMTRLMLDRYELARVLSTRAAQIAEGSPCFSEIGKSNKTLTKTHNLGTHDPSVKACHELLTGNCPLIIPRLVKVKHVDDQIIHYVEKIYVRHAALPDIDIPEFKVAREYIYENSS